MNYDSPQFAAAVKKIVQNLIDSLSTRQTSDTESNPNDKDNGHEPRIIRTELSTPVPIRVENEPKERHPNWNRVKTIAEIIGIAAAIGYGYIATRQWKEMISARHVTQDAINSTKLSADSAMIQVQQNFVIDQRPYVWVTDPDIIKHPEGGIPGPRIGIGQKIWWQVYYQNYGKTPALGINQRHQVEFGYNAWKKLSRAKVSPIHALGDHSGSALAPGQMMYMTAQSKTKVGEKDYKLIATSPQGTVAVLIHFEYFDNYGNTYHSYVCEVLQASGVLGGCDPQEIK